MNYHRRVSICVQFCPLTSSGHDLLAVACVCSAILSLIQHDLIRLLILKSLVGRTLRSRVRRRHPDQPHQLACRTAKETNIVDKNKRGMHKVFDFKTIYIQ